MRTTEAFLTTRDVAEQLGVSPRTLQKWRKEGKGPAWRRLSLPRGPIRYPADLLREWLGRLDGEAA